jgi:myosin heavy subunit
VNPYQWLDGLYSEELKEAYFLNEDPQALPPHVFAVSAAAYR